MLERLPARRNLAALISLGLLAPCALLGAMVITRGPAPWLVPAAALAALAAVLAVWLFGRGAPVLAILALVPLFPVTTIGMLTTAFGGHGDTLRAAFIALMLLALILAYGGAPPKPPRVLRPVVGCLLVLAALGAVIAALNASETQGFVSIAQQLVGQPLAFAGLLVFFSAYLATGERARERMLIAFSIAVVLQAAVVGFELVSGEAYDAFRGFTRAQGTVGANFVSAFAMMGLFVGLAERSRSPRTRRLDWIGAVTVIAGAFILISVVSRGGVIGVLLGGVYVILSDPRLRLRAPLLALLASLVLLASLPTPAGELWSQRLGASSVETFDRPATWISGVRIGIDNVATGLGELEIFRAIEEVPRYRDTPLGETTVIPHNSWILVFAEGGILSLLLLMLLTWLLARAIGWRRERSREERLYVAGLIGIGAIAVINNVFRHPELMTPALMLLSLVANRPGADGPIASTETSCQAYQGADRRL